MPQAQIIVSSRNSPVSKLPGAVVLPNAKERVPLGSGIVNSIINTGGSAIVYEIWNPELEVTRAVKLLHPDHTAESAERFQTEMKITAKLHHPNIIEIYAVGKWNGLPYIEMERIDGVTLEELIDERGALPIQVVTSIAIMVGRALNYAHNQEYMLYGKEYKGIIHRDLKPSNVMINRNGDVKLMDFGIAKPLCASLKTCEGTVMGTMQYLPPEQLNGEMVDVRADVYALGAVLYEMATGARTFPENNLAKLVTDKLANNFVSLDDFSVRLPAKFRSLVQKCLHFEKEHRPESALVLLRALSAIHKSVTKDSPEQVMETYMNSSDRSRSMVGVRRRRHLLPALIWCATAAIPLATGYFLFSRMTVQSPVARSTPERQPVAVDRELRDEVSLAMLQAPAPAPVVSRAADTDTRTAAAAVPSPAAQRAAPSRSPKPKPQPTPSGAKPVRGAPKSDTEAALAAGLARGDFHSVIRTIAGLPAETASKPAVQIYKMRSLAGMGDKSALRAFLMNADIADAEFCLEKATLYYMDGNHNEALRLLQTASRLPSAVPGGGQLRLRLLYTEALCRTELFDTSPDATSKREAIESWFKVKSQLRSNPGHGHFRTAENEIRRIGNLEVASN